MGYNAKKKISIYKLHSYEDDNLVPVTTKELYYSGIELVCPMSAVAIKRDYGLDSTSPRKVIIFKPLPDGVNLLVAIEGKNYSVLERTDFDEFNILLVDILREDFNECK